MEKSWKTMEDPSTPSPSSPVVRRRGANCEILRSLSPTSGVVTFSCELPCEESFPHYLDACHLCGKHLGIARDIFMYRGDTPFCSEECRQEQIELDEARKIRETGYRRRRHQHHRPASGKQLAPATSPQDLHVRAPKAISAN